MKTGSHHRQRYEKEERDNPYNFYYKRNAGVFLSGLCLRLFLRFRRVVVNMYNLRRYGRRRDGFCRLFRFRRFIVLVYRVAIRAAFIRLVQKAAAVWALHFLVSLNLFYFFSQGVNLN